MNVLDFVFGCVACVTLIILTVGICATVEKLNGKDK